ncbi:hypothetical protein GGI23_007647, partial [Coemansia sp. RSA 2559]
NCFLMGNTPSKSNNGSNGNSSGKSRKSTRTNDDPAALASVGDPASSDGTSYAPNATTSHDGSQAEQQQQQSRTKRPSLEGKLPKPIGNKQLYNGHEISATPLPGSSMQAGGAHSLPGTPYMSGGSALGTPATAPIAIGATRGSDYFPLQLTSTRESRKSLGGRMRGRNKKKAAADTPLLPLDDSGRVTSGGGSMPRSYCDLPGMPILTGGTNGGRNERLPPLRETQCVTLTEYVSIASGAEYAIIKHAEKPKQFSVDDMIFRLLDAGFSGKV